MWTAQTIAGYNRSVRAVSMESARADGAWQLHVIVAIDNSGIVLHCLMVLTDIYVL